MLTIACGTEPVTNDALAGDWLMTGTDTSATLHLDPGDEGVFGSGIYFDWNTGRTWPFKATSSGTRVRFDFADGTHCESRIEILQVPTECRGEPVPEPWQINWAGFCLGLFHREPPIPLVCSGAQGPP